MNALLRVTTSVLVVAVNARMPMAALVAMLTCAVSEVELFTTTFVIVTPAPAPALSRVVPCAKCVNRPVTVTVNV